MRLAFLDLVEWHRPWLAPLLPAAAPILAAPDWRAALNAQAQSLGLCNHRNLPIQFVPQAALPPGVAYEAHISATGCVPTRGNLHDFFNALVWLTFPRIKRQLNALQAAEIARQATSGTDASAQAPRGKVRDAATIFDENAALLLCAEDEWIAGLRAHRWRDVLWEQRGAFGQSVDICLFGHALVEKLVTPYKAITAHAWIVPAAPEIVALPLLERQRWIDAAVAQQLATGLSTAAFTPLPVLGIPGWWAGQGADFYADEMVFRPKRRSPPK